MPLNCGRMIQDHHLSYQKGKALHLPNPILAKFYW